MCNLTRTQDIERKGFLCGSRWPRFVKRPARLSLKLKRHRTSYYLTTFSAHTRHFRYGRCDCLDGTEIRVHRASQDFMRRSSESHKKYDFRTAPSSSYVEAARGSTHFVSPEGRGQYTAQRGSAFLCREASDSHRGIL